MEALESKTQLQDKTFKINFIKKLFMIISILGIILFLIGIFYISYPYESPKALPDQLRPQIDTLSSEYLENSNYSADYSLLNKHFESQIYRSYCGVASSVIALRALGNNSSQASFFSNTLANNERNFLKVYFTGMPLADLSKLLKAYGANTKLYYAEDINVDTFREILKSNMENPSNYMLVNYLRSILGQDEVGHISPIGAYDQTTDEALILDVTTYNYPAVWVKVDDLFNAMNTMDQEHSRGLVEVF